MARDRERRKNPANDRRRVQKKKVSILTQDRIDYVDYKDVNLLRRFMSERAKIRARRVTGNNQQQQREIARAIRIAREMALLPYSVRQVTQRSRSGRRPCSSKPRARAGKCARRRSRCCGRPRWSRRRRHHWRRCRVRPSAGLLRPRPGLCRGSALLLAP